jgi:hypothetical protein
MRRRFAAWFVAVSMAGLVAGPAFAQAPPPPAGAGKGHWKLLSDTTADTFKADAVQPGTRGAGAPQDAGAGAGSGGKVFSADAQKGSTAAGKTSFGKALRISGSEGAKSGGGIRPKLEGLLEFASSGPDLFDSAGAKLWKLSRRGDELTFSPYDRAGTSRGDQAVVVGKGKSKGESAGGEVVLGAYSKGRLTGSFRNKLTGTYASQLSGR